MKRILHISKYYYPFRGGTEQTAQDCVNALKEEFDQKVICFNHDAGDVNDYIDGIEIIRCGCFAKVSSQSLSFTYWKRLEDTFRKFKPDIVLFHYPNPFVATILLRVIPKSTKLVIYWHLDIVKQKIIGKLFNGQNKSLIKRADLLIATSPNYIDGSKWLSSVKEKCVVVPSCINEKRLQSTEESKRMANDIKQKNSGKIICLVTGASSVKFEKYLEELVSICRNQGKEYILLTAWNEWGEGATLEPSEADQYAYLKAVSNAVKVNE